MSKEMSFCSCLSIQISRCNHRTNIWHRLDLLRSSPTEWQGQAKGIDHWFTPARTESDIQDRHWSRGYSHQPAYSLKWLPQTTLKPATQTLLGPSQQPLNVIGQFEASIAKAGDKKSTTQTVYVVKDLKVNFLGLPTITSLHLLSQVNSMTTEHPTAEYIRQRFPSLFQV